MQLKCPPQTAFLFACRAPTAADLAHAGTPWHRIAGIMHDLAVGHSNAQTESTARCNGPQVLRMIADCGGRL